MDIELKDKLEVITCKFEFLKEAAEALSGKDEIVLSGFYYIFQDTLESLRGMLNIESE